MGEQRAHASGHHMQRLEAVGEGEVSRLYATGGAQSQQLMGFGSTRLQELGNRDTFLPATDSTSSLMARNASFDRSGRLALRYLRCLELYAPAHCSTELGLTLT